MFIPRHSVVENMYSIYGESSVATGIGGVVAYAGSVVYLDPTAANEDSIVFKMAHGVTETPFGVLMQKVKTDYHQVHPAGMVLDGDLGSSDAIAQPKYNASGVITGTKSVPVAVAHLGIWDTVHYTCVMSDGTVTTKMAPGATLYPAADEAKLTNSTVSSDGTDTAGERCSSTAVARVMKGASIAKCQANIDNTALYAIRVKLLV